MFWKLPEKRKLVDNQRSNNKELRGNIRTFLKYNIYQDRLSAVCAWMSKTCKSACSVYIARMQGGVHTLKGIMSFAHVQSGMVPFLSSAEMRERERVRDRDTERERERERDT